MNKCLQLYIHNKNQWRKVFNQPLIDPANIKPSEARSLLDELEYDLSPENLSCDGELRGSAYRNKAKWLNEAKAALESGEY